MFSSPLRSKGYGMPSKDIKAHCLLNFLFPFTYLDLLPVIAPFQQCQTDISLVYQTVTLKTLLAPCIGGD
ncbi:hypothetical protein XELAEV_18010638mg [Xenopus laevis]|uniref:Uncharacterized protein n=1 Tax=Xenopus laevis TaxID=8355 RepID=A0A974DWR4_XENLA|nr:hypothetical protein XELAEV_18010638mg [Xenopus laevis]